MGGLALFATAVENLKERYLTTSIMLLYLEHKVQQHNGDNEMGKGQKVCENCGQITGPRAYVCKKCNTPFIFKAKGKESKETKLIHKFDWRELIKGDRIKVGGGPYFVTKVGQEFIPMGYRGRFVVETIDEHGILAWGLDKSHGIAHIYMGGDTQNTETGVWKIKHKFIKLKQRGSAE